MRRVLPAIIVLSLAGCSTAPVAGLMDCFAPSRARLTDPQDNREPRGDIRLPTDPPPPSPRGGTRPPADPPRGEDPFLKPPMLDR